MDDDNIKLSDDEIKFDPKEDALAVLQEKLVDIETPGFQAEFDPEEANFVGAFVEDALSEEDANSSIIDLLNPIEED